MMALKYPVYGGVREGEAAYIIDSLRHKSLEELTFLGLERHEVRSVIQSAPVAKTIYCGERPAAVIGAVEDRPGVWTSFGFGTSEWDRVWRLVSMQARHTMQHIQTVRGAHRIQALSPASHADTHKWLTWIGLDCEVDMPRYGANGEDFKLFYWFRETV